MWSLTGQNGSRKTMIGSGPCTDSTTKFRYTPVRAEVLLHSLFFQIISVQISKVIITLNFDSNGKSNVE